MSTEQFKPRVVSEVPPSNKGSGGKVEYDELFSFVWENRPNPVLAAEGVRITRYESIRNALAVRIEKPGNEHIKAEGSFLVQSRIRSKNVGGEPGLVDVYATFLPHTRSHYEAGESR